MAFKIKDNYKFEDLIEIMKKLRAPGGCPWDREQDHHSIRQNFIEETYEAVEAIDNDDPVLLKEELGDVLLQVVFHSAMEEEKGVFTIDDVCDGICKKLVLRHPHVFGDVKAETSDQVLDNWDKIKMRSKSQKTASDAMDSVSRALPSLMRAEKLQKKAKKAGFDWDNVSGALDKVYEEADELKEAIKNGDKQNTEEELGDLLFSCVNVSRFLDVDCEKALYFSCDKFIDRFKKLELLAGDSGMSLEDLSLSELDSLWNKVK